jgi:hypothetical protein
MTMSPDNNSQIKKSLYNMYNLNLIYTLLKNN